MSTSNLINTSEIKDYMVFRKQKYPDGKSALLFAYTELGECAELEECASLLAQHEIADLYQMLQICCYEETGKHMEECISIEQKADNRRICATPTHANIAFRDTLLEITSEMAKILDWYLRKESDWTRNNQGKQIDIVPIFARIGQHLLWIAMLSQKSLGSALRDKWQTKGYR